MNITGTDKMDRTLEAMWEEHHDYLRRMLIGLSHDIDLADDILQETYIRAQAGVANYRGGDAKAWLAAIAKNLLLMQLRSPRVRNAVPMDEDISDQSSTDSTRALTLIHLRQALKELAPSLRTALVMKHYGGFTYNEIAEHMGCAAGTAKWRVSTAIRQLRAALGVEGARNMTCSESRILDYLYGVLSPEEAEEVKRHIEGCESCRREAEEMRGVVSALDAFEGDYKQMMITEIDPQGFTTIYGTTSIVNSGPDTDTWQFDANKDVPLDYVTIQGEELQPEISQSKTCDYNYTYMLHLPRPLKHGESVDMFAMVCFARHQPVSEHHRAQFQDGKWVYRHRQKPGGTEFVYVQAIRLPHGAKLLNADPTPEKIRTNGTTTLTWKKLLAPNEQFDCTVEYGLTNG